MCWFSSRFPEPIDPDSPSLFHTQNLARVPNQGKVHTSGMRSKARSGKASVWAQLPSVKEAGTERSSKRRVGLPICGRVFRWDGSSPRCTQSDSEVAVPAANAGSKPTAGDTWTTQEAPTEKVLTLNQNVHLKTNPKHLPSHFCTSLMLTLHPSLLLISFNKN